MLRKPFLVLILVMGLTLALAGCQKPVDEWHTIDNASLKNVKGLEDCSFHKVETGNRQLYVIRCPASSTSLNYSEGKTHMQSITVTK
jgi:hypothetical protein